MLALRDFSGLVATVRSGPPPGLFRIGWVRRLPNLDEFFVHHEDVRRANGHGPRTTEHELDEALWRMSPFGLFLARRLRGTGLTLAWAGTGATLRARPGTPAAHLTGFPGELLLYLFGRQDAAQVEIDGPFAAVRALRHTHLGM